MARIAIVTDSTADLPSDFVSSSGLSVVPLTVNLGGKSYLDGVDITADEFYARLQTMPGQVSTSQPSPGQFLEVYNRLLADHDHIVSIHISERLSGTLSSARQAAAMAEEDRIHLIDSEAASLELGLIVLMAAELVRSGLDVDQVVARVCDARARMRCFFTVATLEYLRQGGRIGRASALLGSVLQVKPVLTIESGLVTPLEKVRTYDRAIARILELARAVDTGQGICAVVGHAGQPETAERIARELEDCSESLLIQSIGPVVGAHAGPGTVGIASYPAELQPLGLKPQAHGVDRR